MTWFKVDDSFYDHPKVFDAPDSAVALWIRAGTWCARNLTEGFVPAGMPARLCGDPDTAVAELVRRGLWSRTRDGFRFHDWADFQPTAEAVRTLRAQRSAAGKKGGQARAAKQSAKQESSNSQASASPGLKQNATPTRPPSFPEGRGDGGRARADAGRSAAPADDDPPPVRPTARPPDLTELRAQLRGTASRYRNADRRPPALPSTPATPTAGDPT